MTKRKEFVFKRKEFVFPQDLEITSSKQAFVLHQKLPSRWSSESALSQAIEIHILELLEEQNTLLYQIARKKPSNKRLQWTLSLRAWWRKLVGSGLRH